MAITPGPPSAAILGTSEPFTTARGRIDYAITSDVSSARGFMASLARWTDSKWSTRSNEWDRVLHKWKNVPSALDFSFPDQDAILSHLRTQYVDLLSAESEGDRQAAMVKYKCPSGDCISKAPRTECVWSDAMRVSAIQDSVPFRRLVDDAYESSQQPGVLPLASHLERLSPKSVHHVPSIYEKCKPWFKWTSRGRRTMPELPTEEELASIADERALDEWLRVDPTAQDLINYTTTQGRRRQTSTRTAPLSASRKRGTRNGSGETEPTMKRAREGVKAGERGETETETSLRLPYSSSW